MNNVLTDSSWRLRPIISSFRVFSRWTPSLFVITFFDFDHGDFVKIFSLIGSSLPLNQKENVEIWRRVCNDTVEKDLADRLVWRQFFTVATSGMLLIPKVRHIQTGFTPNVTTTASCKSFAFASWTTWPCCERISCFANSKHKFHRGRDSKSAHRSYFDNLLYYIFGMIF